MTSPSDAEMIGRWVREMPQSEWRWRPGEK
jgi:hypothetical protein